MSCRGCLADARSIPCQGTLSSGDMLRNSPRVRSEGDGRFPYFGWIYLLRSVVAFHCRCGRPN